MRGFMFLFLFALAACHLGNQVITEDAPAEWVDLSQRVKPAPITDKPWQEVVITAPDADDLARLFVEIGGFEKETLPRGLRLRAPGADSSFIQISSPPKLTGEIIRPADSHAWDKGCYFSLMMRAKNIPSIIEDAKALGWTPLTEMAYLEFGPSKLNIVVLTHEKTGVKIQLYERLTTALPEGISSFERLSRPFNIMQMVQDRDVTYDFFQQGLGFETFFYGKPYVSEKAEVMPLGIPPELTRSTPYKTAIMTPKTGLEWGRMEAIDIEGMADGKDFSAGCSFGNIGIHTVRFEVNDLPRARSRLRAPYVKTIFETQGSFTIKTPDGANIEFYQK